MALASASIAPRLVTASPAQALRPYVSHYWLSIDNREAAYAALPDGAVDLVVELDGASTSSWLYGTTTRRIDLPLARRCHYLGVRFHPGQSRHFTSLPAAALTDTRIAAQDGLGFALDAFPECLLDADVFVRMDRLLERHLRRQPPAPSRIDAAVARIASARGAIRMQEVAAADGRSLRQFERVFADTVGISPKCFAAITRFRHAADLLRQPAARLASIAAEAGYADQSHMTHAFRRLAGVTPAQLAKVQVAG